MRDLIKQESSILQALDYPNIIAFHRAFMDKKDSLNIVMEYAEHGSLDDLIKQRKASNEPFSEDEILNFFTQICLAVQYIHKKKILHRDIKDENIFLSKNFMVKLGDFGVSKILEGTRYKASTMVGTDSYMAPEVL